LSYVLVFTATCYSWSRDFNFTVYMFFPFYLYFSSPRQSLQQFQLFHEILRLRQTEHENSRVVWWLWLILRWRCN